jgi:hypothetical protein
MSLGRAIIARAMASICCSPPDIVMAIWSRRSASRGKVSAISAIAAPSLIVRGARKRPSFRFSRTVRPGTMRRSSGT